MHVSHWEVIGLISCIITSRLPNQYHGLFSGWFILWFLSHSPAAFSRSVAFSHSPSVLPAAFSHSHSVIPAAFSHSPEALNHSP